MAVKDLSSVALTELVSLDRQVAVVTGGAQGIGQAIAQRLVEAGCAVVIGDRDKAGADAAAGELRNRGARVAAFQVDVLDEDGMEQLAQTAVDEFGRLDIWVNNAGFYPTDLLMEMSLERWQSVVDINLTGTFIGARAGAKQMIAAGNGGVVINLASAQAFRAGGPGLSHYVSAKHGVAGLTKSLAVELGPQDIRVLALAPTLIATPGTEAGKQQFADLLGTDEDPWDVVARDYLALGRPGVPDDVARVALFCATGLSAFMTGSTLAVDAGYLAR